MSRYDWMEYAACAQVDPGLWHSDTGTSTGYGLAKKICASCPVRPQCETHTAHLDADEYSNHGVWAGRTIKDRNDERLTTVRQERDEAIIRLLQRGGLDAEEIAVQVQCSSRTVLRVQKAYRAQLEAAA